MHVVAVHAPPLIETSIPDTATLSEADPLTVNGSGDALFKVAPLAGLVTDEDGAVRSGAVSVVYENGMADAIGLPLASVTAVVTFTL